MASLIYTALASLDGYIEDDRGAFDFAFPDAEVHAFANELEARVSCHLYGRGMYETMAIWQDVTEGEGVSPEEVDFAEAWRFMEGVAAEAERLNHHPDWSNSWNEVIVQLRSHDAGAVTDRDLELARAIDDVLAGL